MEAMEKEPELLDAQFETGELDHGRHQSKLRKHFRTILAAVCLFLVGLVFLVLGALSVVRGDPSGTYIPYFVIAGLTFIPGAYQTVYIIYALRGTAGYRFSEIPSYDQP